METINKESSIREWLDALWYFGIIFLAGSVMADVLWVKAIVVAFLVTRIGFVCVESISANLFKKDRWM